MHRKVAAALVAALALALASCGGGQKTETVSRAQAISRLEAACYAGQAEARRQLRAGSERAEFVRALIVNMQTVMDRVGNLETTGSGKAAFDTYKDTLRTRIATLERVAAADSAELQKAIRTAEPAMTAATLKGHEAVGRLGAQHVCI